MRGGRAVLVVGLAVLCVPVVTVAMVLTHEIGHTVMARLAWRRSTRALDTPTPSP